MVDLSRLWWAGVVLALGVLPGLLEAAEVRFRINDAHVRDRPVAGVQILVVAEPGQEPIVSGETGEDGVAVLEIDPGTYRVSYMRRGYIPIRDSVTEVREDGQVITTTLSMLLEAEGSGAVRRVRIVLNWGSDASDARDVDGHAQCVCGQSDAHVSYAEMSHEHQAHRLELDVDDVDWGGPETITFSDPPPGSYLYWVHKYSADDGSLGESDVVVRVFFDDSMAAEFRGPQDLDLLNWRPFKELVVDADLRPRLRPFSEAELAAADDRKPVMDLATEGPSSGGKVLGGIAVVVVVFMILLALSRRRRR